RQMIREMQDAGDDERAAKFEKILSDVPTLWERYKNLPLKTRIGSGSSNRSHSYGMGLVVTDTVPRRSARFLKESTQAQPSIPIRVDVEQHVIYREPENPGAWDNFLRGLRWMPGCSKLGMDRRSEWAFATDNVRICSEGNLVNLGGTNVSRARETEREAASPGVHYLNSSLTNFLKVLFGFIPAMGSFLYTQEWWFLAWFGPFIWFGITGVRNVIMMVLSAKGMSRSTLMHWRDQVSISRICDSLMYTGISVFLLEVMVYVWFLKGLVGVDTGTDPIFVLTVISMVNGLYICAHNIYRGFPKTAAIGNIFRSILNIPVAMLYNMGLWQLLQALGVQDPGVYLIPSATIISKTASDTVAAIIEGFADSRVNRRIGITDYKNKLRSLFDCYTKLELMFPKEDCLNRLAHPGGLQGRGGPEAVRLERAFIVNALDMMYLWYYQPRAQDAFRQVMRTLSSADKTVLALSQLVLLREREIVQLMADDLVGRNFTRPLAFFLSKHKEYVKEMVRLCKAGRTRSMRTHKAVFGETGQN
ncbi:MAG: hypothetical protein Q4F72_08700, partial [Desulfovibrionaceae bacterium]|nr:hypothetical protein [Desulfovibrionaceae bacterium]